MVNHVPAVKWIHDTPSTHDKHFMVCCVMILMMTLRTLNLRPRPPSDGVTHLGNGLVELDGAIDAAVYDRASREPNFEADEDSFRVVEDSVGSKRRPDPTETHVASQTIFSNFINGNDRQASSS